MDERGELIRDYPRTFSFKNWPFFVFIVFLGGVLALFASVAGNPLGAAFLFGGVLLVPVLFFVSLKLMELRRSSLCGLYENGLLVDFQGQTHFLSWNSFVELRTWRERTDGETLSEVELRFVSLVSRTGVRVVTHHADVLKLIDARVRLTPIDEGFKRW